MNDLFALPKADVRADGEGRSRRSHVQERGFECAFDEHVVGVPPLAKPQRVRVAFQKKTKKAVREETEAEQGFLQAGMGVDGVYDHVSLVATLRGLLHKHDPEYRLVSERATMLTRLSEGLRRQDSTATGLGVKRAVFDQLAAGVVAGEYSKRALGRQLHVSRKRTISASMAPSTTLSVKKRNRGSCRRGWGRRGSTTTFPSSRPSRTRTRTRDSPAPVTFPPHPFIFLPGGDAARPA